MKRVPAKLALAALAVLVLVFVGCTRTTGASHFNGSNNSIRLNALGSCGGSCQVFFRYRRSEASNWTNAPVFTVSEEVQNAPWSQTIAVSPGENYDYQVCSKESSQSEFTCVGPIGSRGEVDTFRAQRLQPFTEPGAATAETSAVFRGRVQSSAAMSATPYFLYGETAAYTDFEFLAPEDLTANAPVAVEHTATDLVPGTTYYYRLCATNGGNEASCHVLRTVRTKGTRPPGPPLEARTGAATNIRDTAAVLHGELESPAASTVAYWFDYGSNPGYDNFTTATEGSLGAGTPNAVQLDVALLPRNKLIHYRLCVSSNPSGGPYDRTDSVCGPDRTFTTTSVETEVTCGQTLTSDTIVGNDLSGCDGHGLVIGADDITLDLNGHTIASDGEKEGECGPGSVNGPDFGIDVAGHDGVTIRDGKIGDSNFGAFEEGVELIDADDAEVANVDVDGRFEVPIFGTCQGILAAGSERVHIHHSDVVGTRIRGIAVEGSDGAVVEHSTAVDSAHVGIAVWGTANARIANNSVQSNSDFGIELIGSSNSQVLANRVSEHAFDGIVLAVGSNDNLVALNTVTDVNNDPDPGDPGQFAGIEVVDGSHRNRITGNTLFANQAPGIAIGLPLSDSTANTSNTVSGNTIRDNPGDGIIVGTLGTSTLLDGNTALRTGDDGIDNDVSGTTVKNNIVRNNADWGIEAVAGTVNGGGNRASGNGRAAQCQVVTCAP